MEKIYSLIVRLRLFILLAIIVTSLFFAYYAFQLPVRVSLEKLFPYDHPFVELNKDLGTKFGGTNTMLVMIKGKTGDIYNEEMISTIREVTDYFYYQPYILRSLTASITLRKTKYTLGRGFAEVHMAPIFPADFDNSEESFRFSKEMVSRSPIFNGLLVSDDGKSALVLLEVLENVEYKKLYLEIEALKEKIASGGNAELYFTGRPVLLATIYGLMEEIVKVISVVTIVSILLLLLLFRNWIGVFITICTAGLCAVWGMGTMSLLKFELSPILIILPVLVSTRVISHSLQIFQRFMEERKTCGYDCDKEIALKRTIKCMLVPNWGAVLTDAMGFFILILIKITIMQEIAISMGLWILWLAPLSGVFVPIVCYYLPLRKGDVLISKITYFDKIPSRLGNFTMTRGGTIVTVFFFGLLLVFSGWNFGKLQIGDSYPGSSLLFPNSEYNVSTEVINTNFSKAGADALILFFRGEADSIKKPEILQYFDNFERTILEKMEGVSRGAWSLVTVLKDINMQLHDGDPKWNLIPDDKLLSANLMLLFSSKNEPSEFARYTDPVYEIGDTIIFFKNHIPTTIKGISDVTKEYFNKYPPETSVGKFHYAGGSIGLEMATTEVVQSSHIKIDLLVYVTIFIICIVSYRSLVAAMLLCVPLVFANFVVTGLMGFMKIGVTIDTLPVVALGAGIGVDFGFYLLSRVKEEYEHEQDVDKSIIASLLTTGKAILFSGLTVIVPLLCVAAITNIKFQAQMGILIAIILFVNMIWSITVTPLLIHHFKPAFLKVRGKGGACRISEMALEKVN